MTKTVRARYTLEFKQEAVRLVTGGQSIAAAARSLIDDDVARPSTTLIALFESARRELAGRRSPAIAMPTLVSVDDIATPRRTQRGKRAGRTSVVAAAVAAEMAACAAGESRAGSVKRGMTSA